MKIGRKVELAKQALASITRHDDAEMAVVEAAVAEVSAFLSAEIKDAAARREARKAAALESLKQEMAPAVSE